MPSVNIYTNRDKVEYLENILPQLRNFLADQLSCEDRKLVNGEMSLRIIVPEASLRIADTELEIIAYSYPERVARQDEICSSVEKWIGKLCPEAGSTYVWLQLSELGHSSQ